MRTKLIALFLVLISPFILFSCDSVKTKEYYDLFNTVTTVQSYANDTKREFKENCDTVYSVLSEYHKLFDIYHEYSGINNLATVNRLAGKESVKVDGRLIDFLLYAKDMHVLTGGKTNIAIGALSSLWHAEREAAKKENSTPKLPSDATLTEAAKHISIDSLIIDKDSSTVFLSDPEASLDVGAIAKGYAAEMAKRALTELGVSGYVINAGGNICALGEKPDGSGWLTSIRNPHGEGYSASFRIKDICCVTSGDYERFYTVDGKRYHHLIDESTLYPAEYFSSVTVFTGNSALADTLSTALFMMSLEDGKKLISTLTDVEVLWISKLGELTMTDGLRGLQVNQ